MKQKLTLSTIILILVETVCLFIPGSYKTDNWHPHESGWGFREWENIGGQPINIFEIDRVGIEIGPGWWFTFVVIFFMVLSLIAFIFAFLHPEHKLVKYTYYTPMASFVVLVGFTIYACEIAEMAPYLTRWEWTIGWLYYIIIAIHILTIIFSILIKFKKYENIPLAISLHNKSHHINAVDELKKYKDLMDSGVITQEEFEAKKKQLLGL